MLFKGGGSRWKENAVFVEGMEKIALVQMKRWEMNHQYEGGKLDGSMCKLLNGNRRRA